jgi:hypothetical protein
LLTDGDFAVERREHGEQRDVTLRTASGIPRNPDAIGRTKIRLAVVLRELLCRKSKAPLWGTIRRRRRTFEPGVVITVHRELAFDGDRLSLLIVEV